MFEPVTNKDPRVIRYTELTQIRPTMVAAFVNAFDVNNKRYELVYGWIVQKAITFRQFKFLERNMRTKTIDAFVHKGEYIFLNKATIVGTYPEDWSV